MTREPIAKLHASEKSKILENSCQNLLAGSIGDCEDILGKVDCEDTRRSGGPSQCKAGEQSEPVGPRAPPPMQGSPKERFCAARSSAIGSLYKPTDLHSFLREQGIHAKKGLSQNFLIDGNIVQKIVDTAEISKGDLVLEIGPGPGALTQALLKRGAVVFAVEMDPNFAKELHRLQTDKDLLEVHCGDILEFPLLEFLQRQTKKIKVVANLPYHITTPILTRFLPLYQHVESLTIMVQKEFADRMKAAKNTPEYSSFTLFLQFYASAAKNFIVSPNCFYPKPKVHSSVVHCKLHTPLLEENRTEAFFQMTRTAFGKRRKMLRSSLNDLYGALEIEQSLAAIGHPPTARPEELGIQEFIALLNALNSKKTPLSPKLPLSPLPERPDSRCRI